MTNRILGVTAAALAVALCAGCIETVTVVKVKPDGSGTVEQTVLMSKVAREQMSLMMQSMAEGFGAEGDQGPDTAFDLMKEDDLRAAVTKLGEGVSFDSAERIETPEAAGYRVMYAFKDIRKLRIDQNPGEVVPSAPDKRAKAVKEFLTFKFREGRTSVLTVRWPQTAGGEEDGDEGEADDTASGGDVPAAALEQVKQMFDGMRVAMMIEVDGEVVKTNATHAEANRITLMDLDFGKVLSAPEQLKAFAKVNPSSVEEAKRILKDVPGMKVDLNPELTIEFR